MEERVFRRHNYWLHAPHLYLKNQMKNEITTTTTPPRPRRERGAESPREPEDQTPPAQEDLEGEAEVEMKVESTPEEAEE